MLMNGYLDDIRNSILVSVANGDTAKAESLQQQVSDMINSAVGDGGFEASVLTADRHLHQRDRGSLPSSTASPRARPSLSSRSSPPTRPSRSSPSLRLSVNDISLIASSRGLSDSSVSQTGTASSKALHQASTTPSPPPTPTRASAPAT